MIRALRQEEIETPEFRSLLWLAAEVDDGQLDAIVCRELPRLDLLACVDDHRLKGFIAFEPGLDPVTIHYLAVAEDARGEGCGRALVERVRALAPGRSLYAETDDDAVAFYGRLGFEVRVCASDPRWPDRTRYACLLSPTECEGQTA